MLWQKVPSLSCERSSFTFARSVDDRSTWNEAEVILFLASISFTFRAFDAQSSMPSQRFFLLVEKSVFVLWSTTANVFSLFSRQLLFLRRLSDNFSSNDVSLRVSSNCNSHSFHSRHHRSSSTRPMRLSVMVSNPLMPEDWAVAVIVCARSLSLYPIWKNVRVNA